MFWGRPIFDGRFLGGHSHGFCVGKVGDLNQRLGELSQDVQDGCGGFVGQRFRQKRGEIPGRCPTCGWGWLMNERVL